MTLFVREDRDDIAVLRLAHGKVSALDVELCAAVEAELDRVADGRARALVLTGTGRTFSAGVDLVRLLAGGAEYGRRFLPAMERFFRALLVFPRPLIAAVNGHAIAGGCIVAAAADYRVMARGAGRIGLPELIVGVPFPRLPLEIVAARLSPAVLRSLVYGGRTVFADEALSLGLVDETVEADRLLDRSLDVARQLGAIPARTFALTKRALIDAVLERVRGSAGSDADAVEAWASPEVHAAIRQYVNTTLHRSDSGPGTRTQKSDG